MIYKWIERAMMLAAISPVVVSPLYRERNYLYSILMSGIEAGESFEKAIASIDTMIALSGVVGTITALVVLFCSLRKQDKQHKEQILKMNETHKEHLNEIRQQFVTQMLQIIEDDRENYLANYIAAAASNIHYYRHLNVSKGVFQFGHNKEIQDNFCVVFWNMRYKYILKMDENYIFDLYFKMYSIKEVFGQPYNPKNIDKDRISEFVRAEIFGIHSKSSYWDFKITIPRFEGEYGRLANDRNFSGTSRSEIGLMDPLKFACIGDAMGEIQVMEQFEIIAARNAAYRYKL